MDSKVKWTVTDVTVYPDRARNTAQAQLQLDGGIHRLVFDNLPLVMDPASVRVAGRGQARVRISGVDVHRQEYEQAPATRVRELEDQIEEVGDKIQAVTDEQIVLKGQSDYLDGMRSATDQYARGLAMGRRTVEDQANLARHLQEQDSEIRSADRALDKQSRGLDRRLNKLKRELSQLQSARAKQRYQCLVDLEVLEAGAFTLELNYVVKNASWQPLYDIRFAKTAEGHVLSITTIAQISQRTGQDWSDIELTVSTARPALSRDVPELKPWYLDVFRPQPKSRASRAPQMMQSAAPGAVQTAPFAPARELREVTEAVFSTSEVQESDTVISYRVPGKKDVPGDGSPHKTVLAQFELDPELDYLVVPKLADAVYRRVKALNRSRGPLLAGKASLFVEEEFIGSVTISYVPVGDEFELLLGVEDRITVKRELKRRETDKVRLRDRRQLLYGYQIELHNLLDETVSVEVHDHVPVARHEEIKIKVERITPEPAEHSELNLLEWRLDIAPQGERDIHYEFQVEHPRNVRVVGLVD